jgi:hypothetical protein
VWSKWEFEEVAMQGIAIRRNPRHSPAFAANDLARAFSSEVDTGSRQENASNQESRAPFRFNRNGKALERGS